MKTATVKRPSYLDLEAQWRKRQDDFVVSTWVTLMREPFRRLYCYVLPSVGATFGELLAVADGQDPPAGYVLATPASIPATDKPGLQRLALSVLRAFASHARYRDRWKRNRLVNLKSSFASTPSHPRAGVERNR